MADTGTEHNIELIVGVSPFQEMAVLTHNELTVRNLSQEPFTITQH